MVYWQNTELAVSVCQILTSNETQCLTNIYYCYSELFQIVLNKIGCEYLEKHSWQDSWNVYK